jgi:hypothetical protein
MSSWNVSMCKFMNIKITINKYKLYSWCKYKEIKFRNFYNPLPSESLLFPCVVTEYLQIKAQVCDDAKITF